jgi:hypothetical protein
MTDTPQHIKELQLKLWLSKSPGERLRLTLEGNGQLLHFWSSAQVVDRSRNDEKSNGLVETKDQRERLRRTRLIQQINNNLLWPDFSFGAR